MYVAFSAGRCTLSLSRPYFEQQSLNYISVYNMEGAPFSSEKANAFV